MHVMFQGGGPAQGVFKTFKNGKTEIRVATMGMAADGMCAVYRITDSAPFGDHHQVTTAEYQGMKASAAALLDMIVEDPID